MRHHLLLLPLLLTYLVVGTLYAVYTPAWQAPDEPAHYNYVRQLATGTLPVIEAGDYDQAYQDEVIRSGFAPQYSVASFEYEDWQPPLYYLLLTPVFRLSNGSLAALRLASVLLGAGVVILAYAIGRRLWPSAAWLALTVTAFVAFLPQHVAILASVNNDSLAELLIAAILFLLIGRRPFKANGSASGGEDNRTAVALGLLLGLGFLTKGTVYLMAPLLAFVLLWRLAAGDEWRHLIGAGLRLFGPAFLLGFLWWGRNIIVYPGLDLLGKAAHDRVVTGQPRTADWIADYGAGETAWRLLRTTFQSFWGQFGWMGVPMPPWVYQLLLLFTGLTLLGLVTAVWQRPRPARQRGPIALLLATFGLSLGLYLAYNVTFVQHQGRYLFPALIPIAIAVAAAWNALLRPFWSRWPAVRYLLPFGLAIALLGLDLLALFRFILPQLT